MQPEDFALLDPVERQVFEQFFQREFCRLTPCKNQLNDVRCQEGTARDLSQVAWTDVHFPGEDRLRFQAT